MQHRLILLRHGETEWSKSGKHTSRTDLELTDAVASRPRLAAEALRHCGCDDPLVISSPRQRALITAELAGLTVDEVTPLLGRVGLRRLRGHRPPREIRADGAGLAGVDARLPRRRDRRPGQRRVPTGPSPWRWSTWSPATSCSSGTATSPASVITRWIEQPVYEGIRFAMAAASIAVCGFEHGVRQLSALGLTGHPNPCLHRRDREPSFVLTGPDGVIIADGVHTAFPRIADARAALASHSAPIILGALPFDISKPAALIRPQSVPFTDSAARVAGA